MDVSQIISFVVLITMIILSMCFSFCETSYASLNAIRLKKMAKDGNQKAIKALKVHQNLTAATTSILIGNTIANIIATSLAAVLFATLFGAIGLMLTTIALTLIILIGCEIIPKTVAKSKPEAVALKMSQFMLILLAVFKPISQIVVKAQTNWEKKQGIKQITATQEELLEIVSTIEREGILVQDERELIESVIAFDDRLVKDVMMPKDQVVWIYDTTPSDAVKKIILHQKFTRMPIVSSKTNQVIGILHMQDILDSMIRNQEIDLVSSMEQVVYIDANQTLPEALESMQKMRSHMLIVEEQKIRDTFLGVVTLEDVVEELVGEIYDEFDELPTQVVEYGHYTFDVDGSVEVNYFFKEYIEDYQLQNIPSQTMNEWIKQQSSDKIEEGKVIVFEHFEIEILEMKEDTILKVRIVEQTPKEERL